MGVGAGKMILRGRVRERPGSGVDNHFPPWGRRETPERARSEGKMSLFVDTWREGCLFFFLNEHTDFH